MGIGASARETSTRLILTLALLGDWMSRDDAGRRKLTCRFACRSDRHAASLGVRAGRRPLLELNLGRRALVQCRVEQRAKLATAPSHVLGGFAADRSPALDHVGARARESAADEDEATGLPPPWHQNSDASDC